MVHHRIVMATLLAATALAGHARAAPTLLAYGALPSTMTTDLSGRSDTLENGNPQNILGGLGSGLAYAGGNTFLAVPDRGPNAVSYNSNVDDTTSYISRFQTMQMAIAPSSGGALPYSLTPTLAATTLLYSAQPLNYGGIPAGTTISVGTMPAGNAVNTTPGKFYFTGRSDNFGTTNGNAAGSANQFNARLDPESIRVSPDGKSIYISDEYGPYLYQFDRATGQRVGTFTLPGYSSFTTGSVTPVPAGNVYVAKQSPLGKNEEKGQVPGNTSGRVDNKGMEGLAISPDGKTLVGILQAATVQDGKNSNLLRIVTVDAVTGTTHEYGYKLTTGSGVSDIVALNSHQFIVDERDGAGVGGDPGTGIKDFYVIDLAGATDITDLGTTAALAAAVAKTQLVDFAGLLTAAGIPVPSKIEGLAFGADLLVDGVLEHTLYVSNDNDFTPGASGLNQFFVVGLTDADLASIGATFEAQQLAIPEPATLLLFGVPVAGLALIGRRRTTPPDGTVWCPGSGRNRDTIWRVPHRYPRWSVATHCPARPQPRA
jgi:hypothetical protein